MSKSTDDIRIDGANAADSASFDERQKESLSALMDGEIDELELRRVLKGSAESEALRDTWRRYQLAAAVMRRDLSHQAIDFSSDIRAAIENEEPLSVKKENASGSSASGMLGNFGRFAIAASVAAIAVFGVQQYTGSGVAPSSVDEATPALANVAAPDNAETINMNLMKPQLRSAADFGIPPISARTVSTDGQPTNVQAAQPVIVVNQQPSEELTREQVQAYLNELMIRHSEQVATNTQMGLTPLARMPVQTQQAEVE